MIYPVLGNVCFFYKTRYGLYFVFGQEVDDAIQDLVLASDVFSCVHDDGVKYEIAKACNFDFSEFRENCTVYKVKQRPDKKQVERLNELVNLFFVPTAIEEKFLSFLKSERILT